MSVSARLVSTSITFTLFASATGICLAQSVLIPVPNRRAHVHDPVRNILYITTGSHTVERFDLNTMTLLPSWSVGFDLHGCDIDPASEYLFCADTFVDAAGKGYIRKIDLANGSVADVTFSTFVIQERGSWDIKIANNGKAFFTTFYAGSGWVPFRELNLATGVAKVRVDTPGSWINPGFIRNESRLIVSPSRDQLLVIEGDTSMGPVIRYDSASNTFPFHTTLSHYLYDNMISFNRLGTKYVFEDAFCAGVDQYI